MADNPLHTISAGSLAEDTGLGQTRWYVEPPLPGAGNFSSSSSSQQSELSALPLLTASGLQQTMLAALGRSDPVPVGTNDAASSYRPGSPEKKAGKTRPKGTLEYKVAGRDTLEKIAARFDVTPSELKKLNRMLSRTVFENQVLYIPDPEFVPSDPPTPEPESPLQSPLHQLPNMDLPLVKMADKPPAHVPGHVMKVPSPPPPPSSATPLVPVVVPPATPAAVSLPRALSEDEARKLDEECYERFIKVTTQHICQGFNKVAGTLLVTPNAIMFDPDVLKAGERTDMLEAGGVVVYMDTITTATLYHDLSNKTPTPTAATLYHDLSNQTPTPTAATLYHDLSNQTPTSAAARLQTKEGSGRTAAAAAEKPVSEPDVPTSSLSSSSQPHFPTDDDDDNNNNNNNNTSSLTPQPPSSHVTTTGGGAPPSGSGESTLTSQTAAGLLSSGINDARKSSEGSGSLGEESSATTTSAISQTERAGRDAGKTSQRDVTEDVMKGEATQDSQESKGPKTADPCEKPATSSTRQGDQLSSSFTGETSATETQQKVGDEPSSDTATQLPDEDEEEAEIQALLAGGRRDSLSALAAGEAEKPSNVFYPTSPEEVVARAREKQGEESSDALVKECADKLVSDILESVSWSSGLNTATATAAVAPEPGEERADSESHSTDPTHTDACTELTGTKRKSGLEGQAVVTEVAATSAPSGGNAEETASRAAGFARGSEPGRQQTKTQTQTQTQTHSTDNTTTDSVNSFASSDPTTTTDPPQPLLQTTTTSSAKRKPAPLSDLHTDTTDWGGSGSGSSEGSRSRPESGTFSPLRSSVQHLSNLFDYTTGFFRPGHSDDRSAGGKAFDVPLVREKNAVNSTAEAEVAGRSIFYVRSGGAQGEEGVSSYAGGDATSTASTSTSTSADVSGGGPPPTIYLHLTVDTVECDRRFHTWSPCQASPHTKSQPHYWFSFPWNKADHLYAFFIQWQPDAFGDEDLSRHKPGFVVVGGGDAQRKGVDPEASAAFRDYFADTMSLSFKKDWEIVSRDEAIRRGIIPVDRSNMPELTHQSSILSEQHILQLSNSLPARTIGYKWSLVYSTSLHGFSLKRLYREVARIDSPILLVLKDTQNTIFGAFLSDPPKLSDHFFGTGVSQLWTFKDKFRSFNWTGDNGFFIKGDESSMSVGAGQGVYGLWLDGDLYHGRSHQCSTFNNIVLSATEDFCISALEAWAFLNE
ncbi:hypothetical protein ACOMHN_039410 [Nucella lapillus]